MKFLVMIIILLSFSTAFGKRSLSASNFRSCEITLEVTLSTLDEAKEILKEAKLKSSLVQKLQTKLKEERKTVNDLESQLRSFGSPSGNDNYWALMEQYEQAIARHNKMNDEANRGLDDYKSLFAQYVDEHDLYSRWLSSYKAACEDVSITKVIYKQLCSTNQSAFCLRFGE